ncbi:T9SS type A sorting domain-containing protein [Polaribacter sp.]|uniref:T9SS type A sorting domain-containing protein n=1 Tax=Polaribacter sp. TaxID=1920175 RepID=UPI003EF23046
MKLKLLIYLNRVTKGIAIMAIALITAATSAQDEKSLGGRVSANTIYPAGTVTIESPQFDINGATFNISFDATPSADTDPGSGHFIESANRARWGVNGSTIDGSDNEEVLFDNLQIVNFVANASGYTLASLKNIRFIGLALRGTNGVADNPRIVVHNGVNAGTFDLGQGASTQFDQTFGTPVINAAGETNIVGSNDITSFTVKLADTDPGNALQLVYINVGVTAVTETDWTGAVGTVWSDAGNWSNGLPTGNSVVTIPSGQNPVVGSATGAEAYSLDVDAGGSLTVDSGGSLIVNGTSSGEITYNVNVADTNWHLVSSPVIGEQYNDDNAGNDWVSLNSIATGSNNSTNRGIATYSNGTPDPTTANWTYFQENGAAVTFGSGVGYSLKRTVAGDYAFTGTVGTSSVYPAITQDVSNWNLVGNPFSSYVTISELIAHNASKLSTSHQAIYVWNGTSYTSTTATDYIHPGQAFFVNSNVVNGNFTFSENLQSHQTGTAFYRENSTDVSLNVSVSDGSTVKTTKVSYLENKTNGLDPGFDVGMFDGIASEFSLYTNLVEDNQSVKFEKQALPNSDYENMIVPVGVKAAAGKELSFTAEALNLPDGIKVFLEDRVANTFTRLDEANSSLKITLTEALDGAGRFYLHTAQSALSVSDDAILNSVSIFKTGTSTLRITGLSEGKASVSLYNLLGKKVMTSSFDAANVQDISLPKLATGVYIVSLKATSGTVNKKIILE